MFESQSLQTIGFTRLAAHQDRSSHVASRLAMPAGALRPSLLRILGSFAQRAALLKRKPWKASSASPDCCPAPACC